MKGFTLIIFFLIIQLFDVKSELCAQSYASMYLSGSTQSLTGWTTLTSFTSSSPDDRSADWSFANSVLSASITSAGLYMVSFSISFSGTVNGNWQIGISVDDSTADNISIIRSITQNSDQGNASSTGYLNITNGQNICLKILPPSSSNITVNNAQVTLAKLSDIAGFNHYSEMGINSNSSSLAIGTSWLNLTNSTPGYTAEHLNNWSH